MAPSTQDNCAAATAQPQSSALSSSWTLQSPREPNVFTFELAPVCIGRSRDCEVSLLSDATSSRAISKKHARLYPCFFENNQQVRWFLKDLDSKHGTSVNGHDIQSDASVQVFDGDTIELARHVQHHVKDSSSPPFAFKCRLHGPGNALLTLVTSCVLNHRPSAHACKPSTPTADKRKYQSPNPHHKHSSSQHASSDGDYATLKKRFRTLEADPTNRDESPLKCPVCFEYFVDSLTLTCSHTFCGNCLRSWLQLSLTCPTCRVAVTDFPVRTRALDNLCVQLVDPTDTAWISRQETWIANATKMNRQAQKIRHAFLETKVLPWPSVWTTWHDSRVGDAFLRTVSSSVGSVREAWCEGVNLTEEAIDRHAKAKLVVATSNLQLTNETPCGDAATTESLRHRLRMFLRYG
ncbi:hypothetical protein H310_00896 [Aphanomyces invadans]|uniref:E3 ubiquitin-protein ligase CHFR n=1 Tax=Aphanomyces invadans TaxID=157072 RepID=A0A024UPP2_9STRA|nr:hypothetical protein H310_00896 [Aphanomyces invadans]ETW08269.1 hypothetical protein H310_00896 [Aphanomyces invadans]|eukprot:XP_008862074.1 hypothetical protein H310_00896 [Aphanomyces invadans]